MVAMTGLYFCFNCSRSAILLLLVAGLHRRCCLLLWIASRRGRSDCTGTLSWSCRTVRFESELREELAEQLLCETAEVALLRRLAVRGEVLDRHRQNGCQRCGYYSR